MYPETDTLPKQPYPVRSAAGLVDFKTVSRVRAKKAAVIVKKAANVLAMAVFLTPTVCLVLVELLIQNVISFIIAVPYLFIRLVIALFRGIRKNNKRRGRGGS
jgi:hypothetical protein